MKIVRRRIHCSLLALLAGAATTAFAQPGGAFPARPVTLVVPTPAGGPSDTAARLVARSLAATWGQPVLVENKPGAGGAIAAQAVMAAPADGHTLLWGLAAMAGLPFVQRSTPYRSMNELAPVSNVLNFGFALFVNRDLPVANFSDFVALGRGSPEKLNFATGTLGEYMVAAHVLKATGVKAQRVAYKGGAQLMPDLMSGQVQANFGPILSGLQHAKAGKLKILASALPRRSPLMPDVPTFAELGIPAGNLPTWNALFAPPRTPPEVTARIAAAVAQALADPAVRSPLELNGADLLGSSPQQLAEAVEAATSAWKTFVREHDIAPE